MEEEIRVDPLATPLGEVEVRVLGALIEKQLTTPEYCPLTLNALTAACNQKSNREPVVGYDDKTVARALEELRERGLARMVSGADMRVPKYYHLVPEALQLSAAQVAALCVLMLRGPQTVGEVRGRTGRMYEFADLGEVEETLRTLIERPAGPLVVQLPRQPGRKEWRYAQLLAGQPAAPAAPADEPRLEPATLEVRAENARLARLEEQVAQLRDELEELRRAQMTAAQRFAEFRKQFD